MCPPMHAAPPWLRCPACAGSESMPDMGLVNADLGTAELLSSADLPPLPGYASPGQLQGDLLDPLSDAGRSPGLKYEALVGSPGEFLSLDTPKGGSLGAFGGVCLPALDTPVACSEAVWSLPPGRTLRLVHSNLGQQHPHARMRR